MRLDCVVINYYINHFIFPVHAKQFDIKLQAFAWDLPLYSRGEQRGARTIGFSGTNDNHTMLPLTIRQDNLPSLQQASAEVLSYLLQPRNHAQGRCGRRSVVASDEDITSTRRHLQPFGTSIKFRLS